MPIKSQDSALQSGGSPDKKIYVVPMLPYPSGDLHVGHGRNYAISDAIARFYRISGKRVLHPIGWDSFGMPAENAAVTNGMHPASWTDSNVDRMRKQLMDYNLDFDWGCELSTSKPEYYKHQQQLFLHMLEQGYIYKKDSWVNWDPVDKTVLANEQIQNGVGWRSGVKPELRSMRQWFFKTSIFADELLNNIDNLDWPERVKTLQRGWIGKQEGFSFDVFTTAGPLKVFTVQPELIPGAKYIAISPHHSMSKGLLSSSQMLDMTQNKSDLITVNTQIVCNNPVTKERMPLLIANSVLDAVGPGAIIGNDKQLTDALEISASELIYNGKLVNSGKLNGCTPEEAKAILLKTGIIKPDTYFRLKDWCLSRQRYWGMPIPIKYCDECGTVPVKGVHDLPSDYSHGYSSIQKNFKWQSTRCDCGKPAKFDTDTIDTFFDSAWYFYRYCNPKSNTCIPQESQSWMPIDIYIGGVEHATAHLIYARAFSLALNQMGLTPVKEPIKKLITIGMVCMEAYKNSQGEWVNPSEITNSKGSLVDLKGNAVKSHGIHKMSKSKFNSVLLADAVKEYGSDAVRWFILSSPYDKDSVWDKNGLMGGLRFISKCQDLADTCKRLCGSSTRKIIDNIEEEVEGFQQWHEFCDRAYTNMQNISFNLVLADLYKFLNYLQDAESSKIAMGLYAMVHFIYPIMPQLASKMLMDAFGLAITALDITALMKNVHVIEITQIKVFANNKFIANLTVQDLDSAVEIVYDNKAILNLVKSKLKSETVKHVFVKHKKIINFISSS